MNNNFNLNRMHSYTISLIIVLILVVLILKDENKSGFLGNGAFFEHAEKSQIVEDYIYQPRLIHKINLPTQW